MVTRLIWTKDQQWQANGRNRTVYHGDWRQIRHGSVQKTGVTERCDVANRSWTGGSYGGMYPHLPPGMDPSHVDLRTFYPYTPNEVKHRKRTTSAQLKVLEGIFKTDTKPNAALRTRLALQLDMTPRGVQVWFQNRRAKEKLKASKAAATSVSINIENGDHDERDDDDEVSPDSEQTQLLPEPEHGSLSPPLDPPTQQLSPGHQLSSAQIMSMRRPSLPGVSQVDNVIPANFDPLARRRSVDPNLLRYATNPYARPSHLSRVPGRPSPYPARPNPMHRPSMPSLHTAGQPMQISEHALYSPRGSLPDNSLYMAQARPLASPIPGPLPQPGFSFGAASSTVSPGSAGSSERNSPDSLQQYSFPGDRPQLPDFDEDDSTYGGQTSRFGSITSVASGDSAYFSDVAEMYPAGFVPDHRRGSSTSSHHHYLGNMMSNLDVNAQSGRRFSLPTSEMQQIQSYSPHTTNGPGPDFQHPQTAYAQSPPDHAPYPQPTSDQPTYPQQAGEQEPQQIHYSPRPADSPAGIGLGGGGGSPSINSSGDGSSYYYSPSASATPESQYTQTTPDPGAALPNMSIPSYTDLPEFAPSMPSQQKYDVPELRAPPTIVPATTGGCYDPLSYDQERSLYPAPTVLPNQLAGYSW